MSNNISSKEKREPVQFFLDAWFSALILICMVLGADAFAEWGAYVIEYLFTKVGIL